MEKNEIKLIALDMDGTLLSDNHEISEANWQAIKDAQDRGIFVVLSTGRSFLNCISHADALGLTSYLVTVNGSEIWDEQRQIVERNIVKTELIEWMLKLARKHNTSYWAINTERNWRNEMPENLDSVEWLKFGFNIEDDAIRDLIFNELKEKGEFELSNSMPTNIEVNPSGISKATGLKVICNRLGIEMKNVMAVGDSMNDLAMIKEAGIGVAMGNAQQAVKEAADWITATNEDDGVAIAIRKWVLSSGFMRK